MSSIIYFCLVFYISKIEKAPCPAYRTGTGLCNDFRKTFPARRGHASFVLFLYCSMNPKEGLYCGDRYSIHFRLLYSIIFPRHCFHKCTVFFRGIVVIHTEPLTGCKQFIQPRHGFIRHWRKNNVDILIIWFHLLSPYSSKRYDENISLAA